MASVSVDSAGRARTGEQLLACVAGHGSASHAYAKAESIAAGPDGRAQPRRRHPLPLRPPRPPPPGVIDHAAGRTVEPAARAWLVEATDALAAERVYLARLSVAAGPMPSTPGGANSETAILAQRAALATLAQSDRRGCALGAALAFAADWQAIRKVLDAAAKRLGIDPPAPAFDHDALKAVIDEAGDTPRGAPAR